MCLVHLCLQLAVGDPTRRAPDPVEVVCWVAIFETGGGKDWAHQASYLYCFARMTGGMDAVVDAYHLERVFDHLVGRTSCMINGKADKLLIRVLIGKRAREKTGSPRVSCCQYRSEAGSRRVNVVVETSVMIRTDLLYCSAASRHVGR